MIEFYNSEFIQNLSCGFFHQVNKVFHINLYVLCLLFIFVKKVSLRTYLRFVNNAIDQSQTLKNLVASCSYYINVVAKIN